MQTAKKSLNDLCLGVTQAQLQERHHRIESEWYSKQIKFEQENPTAKSMNYSPKMSDLCITNSFSSSGCFLPSTQYDSSSQHTNADLLDTTQETNGNESISSDQMSSSQTSLSSAYSSSSFIASAASESDLPSPSDSSEYLENYLSNVKYTRNQLEIDYEKKYSKYIELKENVSHLDSNLSTLHDQLDNAKVANLTLSDNVKNLRKEIEFYRNLKKETTLEEEPILDLNWLQAELSQAKQEIRKEFDQYNKETINEYEECLERNLWEQIDLNETQFKKEADEFDAESDLILSDLTELNKELSESVTEYEQLTHTNQKLNDRLIQLSTNICSFSSLNKEQQDNMIMSYSVKNLERQTTSIKNEIQAQKVELNNMKSLLIKKDIFNLLDPSQLAWHDLPSLNNSNPDSSIKYELNVRPYSSKIEYTKSNLFAYLILNFDVTRNYLTVQQSTNKQNLNKMNSFNCLRIVHDSIDGHNLVIENSHKILDLDLSEWTLRREIQNCVDFNAQQEQPLNLNTLNREVIEFKFPKGFRLKRRKKINLIAAGKLYETDSNKLKSPRAVSCNSLNETPPTALGNKFNKKKKLNKKTTFDSNGSLSNLSKIPVATPTITQTKCACCACKMLTTRKGGEDMDIFEAKEINSWGSGLMVVTKFINNKNIIKLVNYKCLKHIWVNNTNTNIEIQP